MLEFQLRWLLLSGRRGLILLTRFLVSGLVIGMIDMTVKKLEFVMTVGDLDKAVFDRDVFWIRAN